MDVWSLPGLGPALRRRILSRFGDEAAFRRALDAVELEALTAVPGISEDRAVAWIRRLRGLDDGSDFLATPAARRVHDAVMQRLAACAATPHGRNRLRLLAPHADPQAAVEAMQHAAACADRLAGHDEAGLRRHLAALGRAPTPSRGGHRSLLVVAEDDDAYGRLDRSGVRALAALGTPRDLAEAAAYDIVIVAVTDGRLDLSGVDNAVEVAASAPLGELCPDAVLQAVAARRSHAQACAALAAAFGSETVADRLLAALDAAPPGPLDDAAIRQAVEDEKQRVAKDVEAAVADLSLSGADLLRAFNTNDLPAPLHTALQQAKEAARARLRASTGLSMQPFEPGLPVRVDADEVDRAVTAARTEGALAAFRKAQKAAVEAERLLVSLDTEVKEWLRFDADFALGVFVRRHGLFAARFGDGFAFHDSVHLDLAGADDAQRIAYQLGDHGRAALLTGANSGGKSTLLEHLAQLCIMARLGLPVVGKDVTVPWVDQVHLVTARRGLDAGAFEAFLQDFLAVAGDDAVRLVLADEVEAMTELEAGARILAFVLDRLQRSRSLAVVATHLAPQILAHVRDVRVDGIEAKGLDEHHRLVVDRSPRMGHLARSTPELIVQRLAATAKGPAAALYRDLARSFGGPDGSTAPAVGDMPTPSGRSRANARGTHPRTVPGQRVATAPQP